MFRQLLNRPFFIKLFNWEYWPFHVVYAPIYLYWIGLCIRARSFFFFNAANPTIVNGGFLMESKKAIYDLIPAEYYPPTLFFRQGVSINEVIAGIYEKGLQFPLVIKPDIGMQGRGVTKLENESALSNYVANVTVDFIIQAYVAYENEVGIFYYRFPGDKTGHISGIVAKEFLTVLGDGCSTIETLLHRNKRFILQMQALKKDSDQWMQEILPLHEKRVLVPYGNHARGAKFIDASDRITPSLRATIDAICQRVPGFHYGRLDIRYADWTELCAGKNFSIIELNGAGSEPTHMYDPAHTVFYAWKEIIRHWNILARISRANHRLLGIPYMSFRQGIKMFKENKRYLERLELMRK